MTTQLALANPEGANIAAGDAKISTDKQTVTINQLTDRVVIDWKSFDIAKGESTIFNQPSSGSIALNRIANSDKPTEILGNLSANGQIFLINPNGIIFGKSSRVDVGGLVASTADISNGAFIKSKDHFAFNIAGAANANIINQGRITIAEAGLALFVAPNVINNGLIKGHLARIQLGGGDAFAVDLYGDGLVSLALDRKVGDEMISAENHGKIIASGGSVILTAADVKDVVKNIVNNDGIIEAKSITVDKGRFILSTESQKNVKYASRNRAAKSKQQARNLRTEKANIAVVAENEKLVAQLSVLAPAIEAPSFAENTANAEIAPPTTSHTQSDTAPTPMEIQTPEAIHFVEMTSSSTTIKSAEVIQSRAPNTEQNHAKALATKKACSTLKSELGHCE